MKINFNVPPFLGKELEYIKDSVQVQKKIAGDGKYTKLCNKWMEDKFKTNKVLLTTSGSHALDMSAMLIGIKPGDEVIVPSYTFVSTANAFVLRGAKAVFVDIRPDTMNIDENLIEAAINEKTKAIVVVHYAGIACEMDKICEIAKKYNLYLIEDAAQGVMSEYKGKALGTIGDIGCYSFHETKNYSSGEGGAIVLNNEKFVEEAEIIREKGTNRSRFFRGQVDKYTWVEMGSSFLPSEINAAYLYAQLESAEEINENRIKIWDTYYSKLKKLNSDYGVELPFIPENCKHNAHMFYLKLKNLEERTKFINYMKEKEIITVFHYIPLHSAPAGIKYGEFYGKDNFTTIESERLVRLPLYYGLSEEEQNYIINSIYDYFNKNC